MAAEMLINGVLYAIGSAALIVGVALVLFSSRLFKKPNATGRIVAGIIMGLLAIYGSLTATHVEDALANSRDVAPMVAGLAGGPVSGAVAGLIGGAHRYSMGGSTALPCALTTLLAGLIAGFFSLKLAKSKKPLMSVALLAIGVVAMHMLLLLALGGFSPEIFYIVGGLLLPILVSNVFGVVLFVYVFRRIKN